MTYWLTYQANDDGIITSLRIVHSKIKPSNVDVFNDSFSSGQEALSFMSIYTTVTNDGHLRVNEEMLEHHISLLDRLEIVFRIAPALWWLPAALSVAAFALTILHLLHAM